MANNEDDAPSRDFDAGEPGTLRVPPQPQTSKLTARQRFVNYMLTYLGNDLDRGTPDEQHTAALLRVVADALTYGYEAELVALVRGWRREREAHVLRELEAALLAAEGSVPS